MADVLKAAREVLDEASPTQRERLIAMGVIALMEDASKLVEWAERERDEARAIARVLAHSYTHDSRPPQKMVDKALSFPANPGKATTDGK